MRPRAAGIDLDGTGSDQLKSTFALCLKCHERTRFVAHFGRTRSPSHWAAKRAQMNGN
jgi:hypothetical protein